MTIAHVSRRTFLKVLGAVSGVTTACGAEAEREARYAFMHGVASGDPLSDRVLLWTGVTPPLDASAELDVAWVVATDPALSDVVAQGVASASPERDFTVKVDVSGLRAGATYFYAFFDPLEPGRMSPLGRTKTLPMGHVAHVRFAATGCTAYSAGFFNSYAHIAARDDLAFVLHLGDYIYEYGREAYFDPALGRAPEPDHETVSLADYRTRYAQYRTDPDLQKAHATHPFVAIWDDHEFADDIHDEGAENHTPASEGDFYARRAAAVRAYIEWMPVRETRRGERVSLYRRVSVGTLLDLLVLDTRIEHREKPSVETAGDQASSLLGAAQEAWLFGELTDSASRGARFRILSSQVVMMQLEVPGYMLNLVGWDGYPGARERLFDHIEREHITNTLVLSGDFHGAMAAELARAPFEAASYDPTSGRGALLPEVTVTSATSPAVRRFIGNDGPRVVADTHPHIKYVDVELRGYVLVDVTPARVVAEVLEATTVAEPDDRHSKAVTFRIDAGDPRLHVER